MRRAIFLVAVVLCMAASMADATVAVNGLFTNNMVLQRGKPVPVWGTAAVNKTISVSFGTQNKTTTSDAQGNWLLYLDSMTANATGATMTITETGGNTITITNVVVGDVWLCSGQSNMLMSLGGCNRQSDIDSANFPGIRCIWAPWGPNREPLSTFSGNWNVCSPSNANGFSATAFYFARKIYQANSATIPVGLLMTTVGGTRIDPWLAPEGCTNIPTLQPLFNQQIDSQWTSTFAIFNGMVYPFAPYGAKGLVWYQGENSESIAQSADSYYLKMKALQQGWGSLFGPDDFAFYFVQIANYGTLPTGPAPVLSTGGWDADTRLQEANAMALPHAGMGSAIDIGESDNMHPLDKLDLGERLALWALKNEYGQTSLVTSGPILRDVTVSGSSVICSFDYVGSGLMVGSKTPYVPTQEVVGGTLQRFSIAGTDGVWYAASAVISGNTVVMSSSSVTTPKKVAYACWGNPLGCNLYNKEGLPASPFYVDDVAAKYTVTASVGTGGGGTISPAGTTTYLKRKPAPYTITPNAGYYIQDVTVDGVSVGSVKYYVFDPLYANHTIVATFAQTAPSYTITASSNSYGTVTPSGAVSVTQGGTQMFQVVPNAGCRLIYTTIDGARVGARYRVNFGNVRTGHSISAFFAPIPAPGTGTGLRGDYYEGVNFDTFRLSRTDANVNFSWGSGSPNAAIPANGFSARWTGQIEPQFTETYNFYLTADDGAKIWVNNQLVGSSGISLTAGVKVPIKIEYWDASGDATCVLEWYSPSLPREVVPQTQLYPATTPIYTITASAGANGTVSPAGAVLANSGDSRAFSIAPSTGYRIDDVKVDSVSVGAVASYTFSSITANHTISATFSALPSYAVSGKVTNRNTGAAISGAKVGFYFAALNAVGDAAYTATTDASGNYSIAVPVGTWYAHASATGYFTSPAQAVTVSSGPVANINITLVDGTRNIPRTSDLLFSVITDSLPASGSTGNWATYLPAGQTLAKSGSPVVQMVDGVKWERNTYGTGDDFMQGTYSSSIPCNGITIVAAVRPTYIDPGGEPRGEIVDVFYNELFLAVAHTDGQILVCYRGYHQTYTGYKIPDGQKTILSLVVQPNGVMTLFANGVQKWTGMTSTDYTYLSPTSYNTITVGRNNPDGWSTYNGNIGDLFVYKVALSDADRQTIEGDLTSKFITGGANTYAITATASTGGTISPAGTVNVSPGASQTFNIAASAGYRISDVTVDGVSKGAITTFTFTNVSATHSIAATFLPSVSYTITASAGAGGSISPSGPVSVFQGVDQTFTMTPSIGYAIDKITVDGVDQAAVPSYTFLSVQANHTILVTFKTVAPHTITASAGANGSITPSGGVSVAHGANQTFTISANSGYSIDTVTVDGVSQGVISSYTFSNVTANHTISATFKNVPSYTITASAGANGSISPSGNVSVTQGANQTFTITPNSGYGIDQLTVDGVTQTATTSYTFTNVQAAHSISVTFAHSVKLTGTIIGTSGAYDGVSIRDKAFDGNTSTYFDAPNPGTNAWVGLDLGTPKVVSKVRYYPRATFTFRMVGCRFQGSSTADFSSGVVDLYTIASDPPLAWSEQAITNTNAFRYVRYFSVGTTYGNIAELEFYGYDPTCKITASAGSNGSITPSGDVTVNLGGNQTFTITPSAGYAIADLKVDNVSINPLRSYTFTNVTVNHTISASFGKLYGMTNRSVLNDPAAQGKIVKTWGKIAGYTSGGTTFTVNDGYGTSVTVNVNGSILPSGFTNGRMAVVTGMLGSDRAVQAQDIQTP